MENRCTDPKMKEMLEDISYNDRMKEYRKRYDRLKNEIITCSLASGGVIIAMLLFEIFNSWDPEKQGMGLFPIIIYTLICIPYLVIIIKKLTPKYFLLIASVSVLFAIVTLSLIPLILGIMNAAFFFVTKSMEEIKLLEGYPYFLPVKVRNK